MKGSMRQRGAGWELGVYLGTDPVTGKQRYTARTIRGGKRDAQRVLTAMVTEAEQSLTVRTTAAEPTPPPSVPSGSWRSTRLGPRGRHTTSASARSKPSCATSSDPPCGGPTPTSYEPASETAMPPAAEPSRPSATSNEELTRTVVWTRTDRRWMALRLGYGAVTIERCRRAEVSGV